MYIDTVLYFINGVGKYDKALPNKPYRKFLRTSCIYRYKNDIDNL